MDRSLSPPPHTLISEHMRRQNELLHAGKEGFGGSGHKHAATVIGFADMLGAETILDYGCGENTLRKKLHEMQWPGKINEYDPARRKYSKLPSPADLVVCTDVLEHVEPKKLQHVLAHLCALTLKGCFLVIATRPANKILPSGRNAHLIIEGHDWWRERIMSASGGLLTSWRLLASRDVRRGKDPNGPNYEARFYLVKP